MLLLGMYSTWYVDTFNLYPLARTAASMPNTEIKADREIDA
jgi:hypothetical protein